MKFVRFVASFSFIYLNLSSIMNGQVTMTLNYMDQKLSISPDNYQFKIGDFIYFGIAYYNEKTDDKYIVEYEATEYSSEKLFNSFNGTKGEIDKNAPLPLVASPLIPTYNYLPIQIQDKDYSVLKIKRIRRKDDVELEQRIYKFKNIGSAKFDVSTGFFLTPQKNERYSLKPSSDPTKKEIVKENLGSTSVGLTILAHLHSRFPNNASINVGFSIGFEINNDSKIGYLAGASVFFGRDKKFVATTGLALQKVKVISEIYKDLGLVDKAITEIPLNEVWKSSPFLALSYNF